MIKNWMSLIRPKGLEVDLNTLTDTYGKFTAAPLERGYGQTIGNALRRILLSSIQGAAVTSVKFDGIYHEFSSIPGVSEDITDIILNLKGLIIQMEYDEPKLLTIDRKGPAEIKGRDIETISGISILNPDHHIATLDENARFRAELLIKKGKGYVPAEKNKDPDAPIGTIPIDAIFSPIKKVNYTITNARVGQITDYDKLTMEVWTNGSVRPADALAYAAKILKEQIQIFITFEEAEEYGEFEGKELKLEFNENLFKSIDELELSVRASNCLSASNIKYIWQLVELTEADLLKIKNFGRKSLLEIRTHLAEMGLKLGMKLPNFPKNKFK